MKSHSYLLLPHTLGYKAIGILLLLLSLPFIGSAQRQTFTSSGTFSVPAGVTSVYVECWGAGGGGSNVSRTVGGGGGGGAYAAGWVPVVPGNVYNVVVGTGGTSGVNGTSSTFNGTTIVAAGGSSALTNGSAAGQGGTITASVGTTKYAGGNGAAGAGSNAGGGGGGAGSLGNGNNALGATGGAARANNGGAGGAGRSGTRGNGTAGSIYGGGGGGAYSTRARSRTGGAGANGLVAVSWTCPVFNISSVSSATVVCPGSAAGITLTGTTASLPVGVYTITYNLGAPNAATGLTATAAVTTAGTATFSTAALINTGTTTITVTRISSGTVCANNITSGNTAAITVSSVGPAISVQPVSQSACTGSGVTLSVTAPTATSFQWKKNGADIAGATSSTYSLYSYTAADANVYSVNATNACGTTVSNTVYLTTRPPQPAVTAGSSAPTVCSGASINLTAASPTAVTLLSENFNAASNSFTVINNSAGGTAANALWTLRPNGYNYGGNVFNSNDASQFYLSNSDAQGGGGTTATILRTPAFSTQGLSAATLNFYHYYRFKSGTESAKVEISTNGNTWTTLTTYTSTQGARNNFAAVSVNLSSYLNQPVVMIRFKYDATNDWYWAIDNVTVTGTLGSPSYLWSATPAGFTSSAQNPAGVIPAASTVYTATATNGAGCSNSGSVSVTVNNPPAIAVQPVAPAATCSGSGVQTISVAASGPGLSYNWRKGGTAVVNGGVISGQGTATLTLTNPTAANTGNYDVVVSGTCAPPVSSAIVPVTLKTPTSIVTAAAPAAQTVFLNGIPTTLTVSAAGSSLSYQWYTSGTNCNCGGTSTGSANGGQTNSYTPSTSVAGTKYYYCVITGDCGSVTTTVVAVTVNNTNTWTGAGSSDWNAATNWSMGVVPGVAINAVIPAGSIPYPVLTASATVNNLTIGSGASITIGNNMLTINGAVSGTGTITGSDSSGLTIGGTAGTILFTPVGSGNYLKSLTINNGASATLGNALNITGGTGASNEGVLTVTGTGVLNSNGFLTIKSNAFGTARIAPGRTSGGYVTGAVTVERHIPQNIAKSWRLLASNTSGQTINASWQEGAVGGMNNPSSGYGTMISKNGSNLSAVQALGFDTLSTTASLFYYDANIDNLVAVANTNSTSIDSKQGYFLFIRGDRSPGQFNTGSVTYATTSTTLRSKGNLFLGDQSAVSTGTSGWGLVRNPYPSRIDMRNIVRGGTLTDAYQVWDAKLSGGWGVGGYQTFTKSGSNYIVTPGGGSYGPNGSVHNYIESGAAFFIQASGATGSAQVTEACKAAGSTLDTYRPADGGSENKMLLFNLYAINAGGTDMVDGGLTFFDDAYSDAVDIDDVRKSPNFKENFGLLRNDVSLAVEKRSALAENDTLFFDMNGIRQISYRLDIQLQNTDTMLTAAVLEDKFTGISIPLHLSVLNSYTFTATAAAASRAADRFRIVFRTAVVLPVTFQTVNAERKNNQTVINWTMANQENAAHYEIEGSIDGRQFNPMAQIMVSGSNQYRWVSRDVPVQQEFYRIKAVESNGHWIYSDIMRVKQADKKGISVLSTIIHSTVLQLQFNNLPANNYHVSLMNVSGQLMYTTIHQHPGGNNTVALNIPNTLLPGTYNIIVEAAGEKVAINRIIIVK